MGHKERINKVLAVLLGGKSDQIKIDHHIEDDLGADSLDTVEIVMALEEEFEIEIHDEDCDQWGTVGDIYKYFDGRTA